MKKYLEPQMGKLVLSEIKSAGELQKRIALLERKATREKKARNIAENQLERYSMEVYQTDQSLKKALAFATKKQLELEYLSKASMGDASELPLSEMISNMIELTCEYCAAEYGFYLVTKDGVEVEGTLDNAWSKELEWQSQSELQSLVNANLPLSEADVLESWSVSTLIDDDALYFGCILYMNFALSGGKIGWLAFLNKKGSVDEGIFPILATARDDFNSGIRRRLTDIYILERNVQLQESVNKLEMAKRQLIQSEKMASLGQLAAGVAHEINNPLAFIRSNMQVLKEYLIDYKSLHDDIKRELATHNNLDMSSFIALCEKVDLSYIHEDSVALLTSNIEGLNRVRDIVENLKSFSHAGDAKLIQISLNKCVDAALRIAGNVFKYEHQIDNQMINSSPLVLGNLGQLQQVFMNLFINAAYAMQGGGKLSIWHTEENHRVIIHVKDTGCGMNEETISKLFTPFFTTKPVGVGTGLGLSVSYVILEAHNVQVTVDSEIGLGTTFNLSFPVSF
ncbi:histidine kinase [Paraglaciecola psychrophila 170]|uniref:histidine kinase n=2 Tax=Paraglaciecola TaxID=1621534 RepID=M4RTW5_9ALTE|nr:histidine kinase [Paraglaciecola psychrophila 170]